MNDELLALTRENNEMLKRITAYIDKIDSPTYRDERDMRNLFYNLFADYITEIFARNPRSPLNGNAR